MQAGRTAQIPGLLKLNPTRALRAFPESDRGDSGGGPQYVYPDPQSTRPREALASYHKVAPEHVFVGNGSDEVLALAFAALLSSPRPCSSPHVTYPVYGRRLGSITSVIPLDAMRVRADDCLARANP